MLIAFSHLRWGFVWQRPQHLLTRFAREMPVLVVEEPEIGESAPSLRIRVDHGVTVATPILDLATGAEGFGRQANAAIGHLIASLVPEMSELIYWYYTPMALGAEPLGPQPSLTVYDAMDDLGSFLGARPALRAREVKLLEYVDLVFTGGPTLYQQRRDRHPAVHCFPSGVDREHFAVAMNGISRPEQLNRQPRPILGYYGVIDERLDLQLLADVADLRPEWTIALVGPVAKIDPASLPQRDNIVLFGHQAYSDLPAYLACFDVALMPFAQNEATRAISPTKTLEYLAGGKPVISTPIADVIDLYGDVVNIAASGPDVVAAAESLLHQPAPEREAWRARAQQRVMARTWDAIAAEMLAIMSSERFARGSFSTSEPAIALMA
jgi:glycosyltransferase involved in cell wall biosynthesis